MDIRNGDYDDFGFRRTGIWYPALGTRGESILFGPDRANPTFRARASHYNLLDGIDLAFLALEEPVPPTVATPTRLLTSDPGVDWSRQQLRQAGWGPRTPGATTPRFRGGGNAADGRFPRSDAPHMMYVTAGANVQPGDSGGPLYWTESGE